MPSMGPNMQKMQQLKPLWVCVSFIIFQKWTKRQKKQLLNGEWNQQEQYPFFVFDVK